jgi:hypothetical protein
MDLLSPVFYCYYTLAILTCDRDPLSVILTQKLKAVDALKVCDMVEEICKL